MNILNFNQNSKEFSLFKNENKENICCDNIIEKSSPSLTIALNSINLNNSLAVSADLQSSSVKLRKKIEGSLSLKKKIKKEISSDELKHKRHLPVARKLFFDTNQLLNLPQTEKEVLSLEEDLPIKSGNVFVNCENPNFVKESHSFHSNKISFSILTQSLEKQTEFFTSHQPKQWFPLKIKDENKLIVLELPESVKKTKRVIYVFRNKGIQPERFLIGKTGTSFQARMHKYLGLFNSSSDTIKGKEFISDVKKYIEQFEVAILYALQPEEDLSVFEASFIKYKSTIHPLYNQRNGGAGGLAREEESPTTYGIPLHAPFTPPKYYPIKSEEGHIRIQFSPGFKRYVKQLKDSMDDPDHQGFLYAFKDLRTSAHYYGGTGQLKPGNRGNQHCYAAEVFHSKNEKKYKPDLKKDVFHSSLGESPEDFGFNLLPVTYANPNRLDSALKSEYVFFSTLGKAESFTIERNQALKTQQGFNKNQGGGGPLAERSKILKKVLEL